jgi:signal transduction histidine kinase
MSKTLAAHRPLSWSSITTFTVEMICAAGFVTAVYLLVVGGGTALWPQAGLLLWIAAATLSGSGLAIVRRRVRELMRRLLHLDDPYPALASPVLAAVRAGPAEDTLTRLAELLAVGVGARSAAVWLAGPEGLRRVGWWPTGVTTGPALAASEAELAASAAVDHVELVSHARKRLGALTLCAPDGGFLTPPDLRLAADVAAAAGLLLHNVELTQELTRQIIIEETQAGELTASRRRVAMARDTARLQLGTEIQARVCEPLERCAAQTEGVLAGLDEPQPAQLLAAELPAMTAGIESAIADFRRIVRGVYPPVLTDHGLVAALEVLLSELHPQARLTAHDVPRLADRVEAGVYFCAAAVLRAWPADGQSVRASLSLTGDRLTFTIGDSARETVSPPAEPVDQQVLEAVMDRVAALTGTLHVDNAAGHRSMSMEVAVDATEAAEAVSVEPGR